MKGIESTVQDAELVDLQANITGVGNIVVCQKSEVLDWDPVRTYFLYDVPNGSSRGGHAHKELQQIIIALSGSFEVCLNDGSGLRTVFLRSPQVGLKLPPGLWRELRHFSGGAICLVLASNKYDEGDYIRDWQEFTRWKDNDNF